MTTQRVVEILFDPNDRNLKSSVKDINQEFEKIAEAAQIEIDLTAPDFSEITEGLEDVFSQSYEIGDITADTSALDDIFEQAGEDLEIDGEVNIDDSDLEDVIDSAQEDLQVDGEVNMDTSALDEVFEEASETLEIDGEVNIDSSGVEGAEDAVSGISGAADESSQSVLGLNLSLGELVSLGGPVAALAATVLGLSAAAFEVGRSFDATSDSLIVATGASGDNLAGLEESLKNIGKEVNLGLGDSSGVVGDLNTLLGVTGESLEAISINLIDAAELLGEDEGGIANSFGKLSKQIGLTEDELVPFSDGLFKLTQDFGIGMKDLIDQVATLRPALGFAFDDEEISTFVATLDSVGISATQIQGPFSKFLKTAAESGEDPREAFDALVEGIINAETEAEALDLGFQGFGSRGGAVLTSALRDGTISLEDLNEGFDDTAGLIQDTEKEVFGFTQRLGEYRNRLTIALEPLGETVFDSVEQGLRALYDFATPAFTELTGGVTAFFNAFSAAQEGDVDVTSSGFAGFMEGLANTIVVDLLPAAQSMIATFQDDIIPLFRDRVIPALEPFAEFLVDQVSKNATDVVIPAIKDLAKIFKDDLVPAFEDKVVPALESASELFEELEPIIKKQTETFRAVLLPVISAVAKTLVGSLKVGFTVAKVAIDVLIVAVKAGKKAFDGVKSAIDKVASVGLGGFRKIRSLFDQIKDSVDDVKGAITGFKDSLSNIPTISNPFANVSVPNVPSFGFNAYGGIGSRPRFSALSEFGHEEAVLPTGASIDHMLGILAKSKHNVIGRLQEYFGAQQQQAGATYNTGGTNNVYVTVEDRQGRSDGARRLSAKYTANAIARRLG